MAVVVARVVLTAQNAIKKREDEIRGRGQAIAVSLRSRWVGEGVD